MGKIKVEPMPLYKPLKELCYICRRRQSRYYAILDGDLFFFCSKKCHRKWYNSLSSETAKKVM
jgi:hypothetical protein